MARLPVVLKKPLDVGVSVLSLIDSPRRLRESVEVAQQRVRIRLAGVDRVARIVAERDSHRITGSLVLAIALYEDSRLRQVTPPHLADVVNEIEGRVGILVWELAVSVYAGVADAGSAAELYVDELA